MMRSRTFVPALLVLLGACAVSMGPPRTKVQDLHVALFDAAGDPVGSVSLTADSTGVALTFDVHDLPPGPHAVHLHRSGKCERPDFLSAGPHLDDAQHQHGLDNPAGPHLGDLDDLVVGPDGRAHAVLRLVARHGRFATKYILDGDGSAVIIHAGPDDRHTDPSGQSGPRIACGIVA